MRPLTILLALLPALATCQKKTVPQQMEEWYKATADQTLPQACAKTQEAAYEHSEANVVFDMVNCDEEGATKEFLFDDDPAGAFADDGRYKGMGVVSCWEFEGDEQKVKGIRMAKLAEVQKDEDRQTQKCLKLRPLFGGSREIWRVAGKFFQGRPTGEVKVVFSNKEKALMHFNKGVPHGRFRYYTEDDHLMAVGEYDSGKIDGPCWSFPEPASGADGSFLHGVCDDRAVISFKANSFTISGKLTPADVAGVKVAGAIIKGKFVADGVMDECMEVELVRFGTSKHCVPFMFSKELDETAETFMQSLKFGIRTTIGDHYSKSYCYGYEKETEPNPWNEGDDVGESLTKWTQNILAYSQISEDPIWPISNDTSPLDAGKKTPKFFSGLEHLQKNTYEAVINFLGEKEAFEFQYEGPTNKKGLFHGVGKVIVAKKQMCLRGNCGVPKLDAFEGRFHKGKLTGRVRVEREGKVHYVGVKEDVQHGVTVSLGQQFSTEGYAGFEDQLRPQGFSYIASYENGKPNGKVWVSLPGAGFIYGNPDKDKPDTVTDTEAGYLYQGMKLALVGEFKQNELVSAKAGFVKRERCGKGVKEIEFEVIGDTAIVKSPATKTSLGEQPTVADPYEAETVKAKSGGGLEAVIDLEVGKVAAFYSGLIAEDANDDGVELKALSPKNPVWFKKPAGGDYVATMGHNARFAPAGDEAANALATPVEHPRLGLVPGLAIMKAVAAGEEILVHDSWRIGGGIVKDEL